MFRTPFAVLDGALATELERHGYVLDGPLWSARCIIEAPEAICAVHRSYADAGADIISTATYQASHLGFAKRGIGPAETDRLFARAAELARTSAPDHVRVAGSLGGYGAFLADGSEYRGHYGRSVAQLVRFHAPRVAALAPHVDLIAFETIPALEEVEAISRVLAEYPDTPAWIAFSCVDPTHLCDGATVTEALDAAAGIAAVGINCCDPAMVTATIAHIAAHDERPIVAYPNSGERYRDHSWWGEGTTIESFVSLAHEWVAAGAHAIGGCCRTRPAHIAALRLQRDQPS